MNVDGSRLRSRLVTFCERLLDVILHKCHQALMFALSVVGKCEAWDFQGGFVVLVRLLKHYHVGLGGGDKAFHDVELLEHEALDIELEKCDV